MCALPLAEEIEYPTSDGQPMAETPTHRKVITERRRSQALVRSYIPEGQRLSDELIEERRREARLE